MKLHRNASPTVKQRQEIKTLYATGNYRQIALAKQFGTTRKTISKWLKRESPEDLSSSPKQPHRTITSEFEEAVKAYRACELTQHHGKVRIAYELC